MKKIICTFIMILISYALSAQTIDSVYHATLVDIEKLEHRKVILTFAATVGGMDTTIAVFDKRSGKYKKGETYLIMLHKHKDEHIIDDVVASAVTIRRP